MVLLHFALFFQLTLYCVSLRVRQNNNYISKRISSSALNIEMPNSDKEREAEEGNSHISLREDLGSSFNFAIFLRKGTMLHARSR